MNKVGHIHALFLFGVAACTVSVQPETNLAYSPLTNHWPMTVALDYRSDFPEHVETSKARGGRFKTKFRITAGPPSARVLERVTQAMFQNVVVLRDDTASDTLSPDTALMIRPDIEKFGVIKGQIRAVYRFRTLTRDGNLLDDWRVTVSRAGETSSMASSPITTVSFSRIIENAMAEFARDWENRPGVEQWLGENVSSLRKTDQTRKRPVKSPLPRLALVNEHSLYMGECMARALQDKLEDWEVVDDADLRDVFFPWLIEKESLNANRVERLRRMPGYTRRQQMSGLLYIIQLTGDTVEEGFGGVDCDPIFGGCFGAWDKERRTGVKATIWNLSNSGGKTELSVSKKGRTGGVVVIIPLFHISRTEGHACEELSKNIAEYITATK